jgi:hypothetical protein
MGLALLSRGLTYTGICSLELAAWRCNWRWLAESYLNDREVLKNARLVVGSAYLTLAQIPFICVKRF